MKTVTLTPEEMARRTVRFASLESYQAQQARANGVPQAVLERIAAYRVYPVIAPEGYVGRSAFAPLKGAPGLSINIAECPPGDGPGLHCHDTAIENFLCLSGRFKVVWGDRGEHALVLEPLDFCSVPPGVMRAFVNVSDETARLLVIIQIPTAAQVDRVAYAPEVGAEIAREFGPAALAALARAGFTFDAGVDA